MGHACTHGVPPPPRPNGEHPIVAIIAVLAIFLAILLITWARLEVHGTEDFEEVLAEPTPASAPAEARVQPQTDQEREVDAAVTSSRFATGLSP
jgi:hypothetical protein